jgi:hypothetical protein
VKDFYTSGGIHVYVKNAPDDPSVNLEKVIAKVEETVPEHLLTEVEMVVVGWFEEFAERELDAFYSDGALYISNIDMNEEELFDNIIHELAHSIEEPYGYEIYGDKNIEKEFLSKRLALKDILWAHGYKAPESFFQDLDYSEAFDEFLYEKIGYDKLALLMQGLFISPYAATSLKEYFATGFTEFYLDPNHNFFKTHWPRLYKKIAKLQRISLDIS